MFQIVYQKLLEDKQRSDRSILYAQSLDAPIYGALSGIYEQYIKELDAEYLADLTNATSITDGIYAQMGVELGL